MMTDTTNGREIPAGDVFALRGVTCCCSRFRLRPFAFAHRHLACLQLHPVSSFNRRSLNSGRRRLFRLSHSEAPGFLEAVGRWMDESAASMNKRISATCGGARRATATRRPKRPRRDRESRRKARSMPPRARPMRLASSALARIATGRERCATRRERCARLPAGRRDAVQEQGICRRQQHRERDGREVSGPGTAARTTRQPGECPIEHTVTRAMCQ